MSNISVKIVARLEAASAASCSIKSTRTGTRDPNESQLGIDRGEGGESEMNTFGN